MHRRLFGSFLVDEGYITEGQLLVALEEQARLRRARIGDILVARGAITRKALERAAVAQIGEAGRRLRIGEFLVAEGLLEPRELERALAQQERERNKRIGEILVELGFLTHAALAAAVRTQLDERAAS